MAEVSLMSRDQSPLSYSEAVYSGDYDKRLVSFKNYTGVVYLEALSSAYFRSFINEDPDTKQDAKTTGWFGSQEKDKIPSGDPNGDYYKVVTGGT